VKCDGQMRDCQSFVNEEKINQMKQCFFLLV